MELRFLQRASKKQIKRNSGDSSAATDQRRWTNTD